MYAIVDLSTNQLVPQKGETALMFGSLQSRVYLPNGDTVDCPLVGYERGPYKILAVQSSTVGSGPVLVSKVGPDYANGVVTITNTLREYTQDEIAAHKAANSTSGLSTAQNKTILDALWELNRAIRGVITLPTETKSQYADRIKAMWVANEP